MIKLQDKHLEELSEETGISLIDIHRLYATGLLNESRALDFVLYCEYNKVKKLGQYSPGQIISRLSTEFFISEERVKGAVYRKHERWYYCQKCGKRIKKSMYVRNDGLCDKCVSDSIKL